MGRLAGKGRGGRRPVGGPRMQKEVTLGPDKLVLRSLRNLTVWLRRGGKRAVACEPVRGQPVTAGGRIISDIRLPGGMTL